MKNEIPIPSSVSSVTNAPASIPTDEVGKRVQEKLQRAQTEITAAMREFLAAPTDGGASHLNRLCAEYASLSASVRALLS